MRRLEFTTITELNIKARAGASIYDCIAEAISISATEGVSVNIEHQGVVIKINTESLIEEKYNEWDKKLQESTKTNK